MSRNIHSELMEKGYAVIEGVLAPSQVSIIRDELEELFEKERRSSRIDRTLCDIHSEEAIVKFYQESYSISAAEARILAANVAELHLNSLMTPSPVPIHEMNKAFLPLPTFFDDDASQRIWNMLGKCKLAADLVEHPVILDVAQRVLGADCVLHDCSATSIGAHTAGGAWHVDVPLGQLAEPLPDFPITLQNAWVLDAFTTENGATRVVPGSHRSRCKPSWDDGVIENEIALEAPSGSVAVWLSSTWHRSGPNSTDHARRAVLCYYGRSWTKPFYDIKNGVPTDLAKSFSDTVRYLIGYGSTPIPRG